MHAFSSSIVVFLVMDHRVHHPHHGGGTVPRARVPVARCCLTNHVSVIWTCVSIALAPLVVQGA